MTRKYEDIKNLVVCGLLLLSFEFISQAHPECKWIISGSAISDVRNFLYKCLLCAGRVVKGVNTLLKLHLCWLLKLNVMLGVC